MLPPEGRVKLGRSSVPRFRSRLPGFDFSSLHFAWNPCACGAAGPALVVERRVLFDGGIAPQALARHRADCGQANRVHPGKMRLQTYCENDDIMIN